MENENRAELLGHYGATLSLIEIGLGSILHAFHIPFGGHFMSLNQGYLLCRVSLDSSEVWSAYAVSNVAAILKSLSPAGQKLGPMLSLSMQGLLFNLGILILGKNVFGLICGMLLLSTWAFLQPLITYYLFFGEKLFDAAELLYKKTLPFHGLKPESLLWLLLAVIGIKLALAVILGFIAWRSQGKAFQQEKFTSWGKSRKHSSHAHSSSPVLMALRDLCRPLFLISLLMTGVFLYFSEHSWSKSIWYLLRPIALGFIFFYVSRTISLERLLTKMEKGRFHVFARGCREALERIRK